MFFVNTLKGVVIGAANILPGVSGATLALILGIYTKLIESINSLFKTPKNSLKFLVPVVLGMAVGIVMLGSLIDSLLESFPLETGFFISGLMIGSLPMLYMTAMKNHGAISNTKNADELVNKSVSPNRGKFYKTFTWYFLVSAFSAFVLLLTFLISPTPAEAVDIAFGVGFLIFLFLGGALAAAALLIPGVSGAMVFIMLGLYPVIIGVLGQIREFLLSPTDTELLASILSVALPIGFGIVFGVLVCSRLIAVLLRKHHKTTYFVIIGLVTGSVFALFAPGTFGVEEAGQGFGLVSVVTALLMLVFGFVASYALGKRHNERSTVCGKPSLLLTTATRT